MLLIRAQQLLLKLSKNLQCILKEAENQLRDINIYEEMKRCQTMPNILRTLYLTLENPRKRGDVCTDNLNIIS